MVRTRVAAVAFLVLAGSACPAFAQPASLPELNAVEQPAAAPPPSAPAAAGNAGSPAAPPPSAQPQDQRAAGQPEQSFISALTPPDVSSPRASLQSFRSAMLRVSQLLGEAYDEQQAAPGLSSPDSALEKAAQAEALLRRAARVFDFSQVPPASLRSVSTESTLLLKEILDSIPLPPPSSIPDAASIEAEAERDHEPPLSSWTIPGTEITFKRVAGGASAGSYLVSPETIARLEEFYNLVADRPSKPDVRADLYDFYSLTPGMLLPPKWLGGILAQLPDWAQEQYLDEAIWQWAAMILGAALCVLFVYLTIRLEKQLRMPTTAVMRNIRRIVLPLLIVIVAYFYDYVMDAIVNVTGPVLRGVDVVTFGIFIVACAWAAVLASNTLAEWILEAPTIPSRSLDANLLRAVFRVLGLATAAVILGNGATSLGIPLVGVIAGLGVGGLAIALAAQPTIENFIGGIILYTDRPVRVGDDCQFGDMRGTVEEIGIRSTRIRSKDRTVITVPNADFAKMRLINFTRRDRMELSLLFGLRYETTPDQLRYVLTRLKELLYAHPLALSDTVSVRFVGLAGNALNVEIKVALATREGAQFDAVREDLLLRGLDIVHDCGTDFAIPSQTLYLTRDKGLDPAQQEAAKQAVETWREENRLPFPNLPNERIHELHATLDWPPNGSPPLIHTVTEQAPTKRRRRLRPS